MSESTRCAREVAEVQEAAGYLQEKCGRLPKFALVLGSGLNRIADSLDIEHDIPYPSIPHCPASQVQGHRARLLVGKMGEHRLVVLQGRVHYYEGHTPSQVVLLSRAIALAGVSTVFLTNAAGGLHSGLKPGDLMLITDHLNLTGVNPLVGPNHDGWGTRFPDLNDLYSSQLRACFLEAAKQKGIELKEGVYVGLQGPSYETPAEVRMYRLLGGDSVGMSTVLEAIALRHLGVRVVAMSCITNLAAGVATAPANHEEVLATGASVAHPFSEVLKGALKILELRHEI